ncbi:tetratricopeptide repeat protein [Cellulophaga baltica]|uniref:tetratricopeptide repeat protein n=1 Tax=Cellulophaga baltica TaxID=76594 RepID=UPI0015F37C8B|nr:tetratricopeptide repeat protein [Cellulophaga baltica]
MKPILFLFVSLFLHSCAHTDCPEDIHSLPKYGNLKKCAEQLRIDAQFLRECDQIYPSRALAAVHHIDLAWDLFDAHQIDDAMKRFNQAWLLDKSNADIYWGYGNLMGQQGHFEQSLAFFDESIQLNAHNAKVWESKAVSYCQLFFKTKELETLEKAISCSKKSLTIDPENPRVYAQLAGTYSYFIQKDSLAKYIQLTDEIDATLINPELRKQLNRNNQTMMKIEPEDVLTDVLWSFRTNKFESLELFSKALLEYNTRIKPNSSIDIDRIFNRSKEITVGYMYWGENEDGEEDQFEESFVVKTTNS